MCQMLQWELKIKWETRSTKSCLYAVYIQIWYCVLCKFKPNTSTSNVDFLVTVMNSSCLVTWHFMIYEFPSSCYIKVFFHFCMYCIFLTNHLFSMSYNTT